MKSSPRARTHRNGAAAKRGTTGDHDPGVDHASDRRETSGKRKRAWHFGDGIRLICLYPSLAAGKIARGWIKRTMGEAEEETFVEYFNYSPPNRDLIAWNEILERLSPDIVLMVGDDSHPLESGLRHSLRQLFSGHPAGKVPLVIFRDLEPAPGINTRVLLDYISALSLRHHCELNAMDGNGSPIGCFKHPRLLLKGRKHHE